MSSASEFTLITGFPRTAAAALPTSTTSKCEQAIPANSLLRMTDLTFVEYMRDMITTDNKNISETLESLLQKDFFIRIDKEDVKKVLPNGARALSIVSGDSGLAVASALAGDVDQYRPKRLVCILISQDATMEDMAQIASALEGVQIIIKGLINQENDSQRLVVYTFM